jgi:tetratricopeptide (TPR) repeat protein
MILPYYCSLVQIDKKPRMYQIKILVLFSLVTIFYTNLLVAQSSTIQHQKLPVKLLVINDPDEARLFAYEDMQSPDSLLLWMILTDTIANQAMRQRFMEDIQDYLQAARQWKPQKPEKQVKKHYKEVHKRFFDKYEINSQFGDIFRTNTYNCVTATALFAYLFSQLNIPFQIQEYPQHVNLIAYPNRERILVETTDPATGLVAFDAKRKKQFAADLRAQKVISEMEYLEGPDAVFNKYFFHSTPISFRELVGIQYANTGIFLAEKEQASSALSQFVKGYQLHQGTSSLTNLYRMIINILDQGSAVTPETELRAFTLLAHLPEEIQSEADMVQRIEHIGGRQRQGKADTTRFSNIVQSVLAAPLDSLTHHYVSLIYHYEMGLFLGLQHQSEAAFDHLIRGFVLEPDNVDLQHILLVVLGQQLDAGDPLKAPEIIEQLSNDYPKLMEVSGFFKLRMRSNLIGGALLLQQRRHKDAFVHFSRFETLYADERRTASIQPDKTIVEQAYKEIFYYYFQRGDKTNARKSLQRGLDIYPGSFVLKNLMDVVR